MSFICRGAVLLRGKGPLPLARSWSGAGVEAESFVQGIQGDGGPAPCQQHGAEVPRKRVSERYRRETTGSLPKLDDPCPQGIQGDDCVHFKGWLQNCYSFGFGDCGEQLESFRRGRKTLSQILAEQDRLIRQTRPYSTASGPQTESSGASAAIPAGGSQGERLKGAFKQYGSTVVVFHVGISLLSLGGFYLLVSSGIDMASVLSKIGLESSLLQSSITAGASTFIIAYAVHKVFAPVRIGITLSSAPFIVRYLRQRGVLKSPKP